MSEWGPHRPVRTAFDVDVGDLLPFDSPATMRGFVMTPADLAQDTPTRFVYAMVGGGTSVATLDLHVAGEAGYSFAEYLASHGFTVCAMDHPGCGASSEVADIYLLDAGTIVRCHARALALARERVGGADVVTIGIGHSMGGMLTVMLQDRERCFDAIVVLSYGDRGLPEVLTADELSMSEVPAESCSARIIELARLRFGPNSTVEAKAPAHGMFLADDTPLPVRAALADHLTALTYTSGLTAMVPGAVTPEMARIREPVFVGMGEHDLIPEPHRAVASYPSSPDVRLYVLPGAGHLVNQAANRHELWRRISDFGLDVGQ